MSLVMAAWRPDPEWLRQAVVAALAERGCEIELIVVDDESPQPMVDEAGQWPTGTGVSGDWEWVLRGNSITADIVGGEQAARHVVEGFPDRHPHHRGTGLERRGRRWSCIRRRWSRRSGGWRRRWQAGWPPGPPPGGSSHRRRLPKRNVETESELLSLEGVGIGLRRPPTDGKGTALMLRLLFTSMMLVALLAAPASASSAPLAQPAAPSALASAPRPVAPGPVHASVGGRAPVAPRSDIGLALDASDLIAIAAGSLTLLLLGSATRRLPGPLA